MKRLGFTQMTIGYLDGLSGVGLEAPVGHGACYTHGWLNGRDDRIGMPRDTAANLRVKADECEFLDELAGIGE